MQPAPEGRKATPVPAQPAPAALADASRATKAAPKGPLRLN